MTNYYRKIWKEKLIRLLYHIKVLLNPLQPNTSFHIEIIHLFFREKQMTSLYMKHNTGLNWLKLVGREIFSLSIWSFFSCTNPNIHVIHFSTLRLNQATLTLNSEKTLARSLGNIHLYNQMVITILQREKWP